MEKCATFQMCIGVHSEHWKFNAESKQLININEAARAVW